MPRASSKPVESDIEWIAENIPANVMFVDLQHRIKYINFTVPDLTPEAVFDRPVFDFMPPQYHGTLRDCFARVAETGRPDRYESQYVASDGETSEWESRVAQAHRAGEHVGYVIVSTNVTQRHEEEAERTRLFEVSLDLLCVATVEGYFKRLNPRFTAVLGFSEQELTSRPFIDLVHPEDQAATRQALQELGQGVRITDFQNRYRTADGSYRTLSWQAIAEPALGLIYATARDVTEDLKFKAQLLQSQKMEALGRLAGGMAHDFNNLLLAIQINCDLAKRRSLDGQMARHLHEIGDATTRAAGLTRQLLALSRQHTLQKVQLRIEDVVQDLSAMVRRLLPETIAVEVTIGGPTPPVLADPSQIEQVLLNLSINARDAMPNGGTLRLSVAAEREGGPDGPEVVVLRVKDDGEGMTRDVVQHIFEPFYTTKPLGEGSGLGLATVYAIVQRHDGTVRVVSEPGQGSTFEVRLPSSPPGTTAERPRRESKRDPDEMGPSGTETILLAEDATGVRLAVTAVLEHAGYRVLPAKDGEEALKIARERGSEIQGALLDVVMPGLSGPDVARRLGELSPHIRILLTSGYSDSSAFRRTGTEDDWELLPKPYRPGVLLRRLRARLDAPATTAEGSTAPAKT